ncbi:MAG TPA: gluconeogenesis factor YvcK family protein [Patescibacteria group bacterium]|nr:gluconeogenesis factor YvcK family protein [Patescibacteria group bacterium]
MTKVSLPSVVVIGGGTGTYTLLSGLRDLPLSLCALLTMVDDGGSNRVLRDEFGLLPTSGVRLALAALSKNQPLLRELFLYRFHQGKGISGMTFGNLFLAAMTDIVGSQSKAIQETCKLLSVRGEILPISYDDVRLVAKLEDGREVVGEHAIDEPEHDGKIHIQDLYTVPKAKISPEAAERILAADYIVLGPGDFYTNTIANLVIGGVREAIVRSRAKLIFVVNLMTKYGETYGFSASTFLEKLDRFLPSERVDFVVMNTDREFPQHALDVYTKESSVPIVDDLDAYDGKVKVIRAPILSHHEVKAEAGDVLARSIIRHDSGKLGKVVFGIIKK